MPAPRRFYKKKQYVTKKEVKSMLKSNLEVKHHDLSVTNYPLDPAAALLSPIQDLTVITQGLLDYNRVGDRIKLKTLQLRYYINCTSTNEIVRLILFQWKDDSSIAAAPGLPLLEKMLVVPSGNNAVISTYNHDTMSTGSISVLYDKSHTLADLGTYGAPKILTVKAKVHTKYMARNLQYVDGGSQGKNKIYLFAFSNQAVPTSTLNYFTSITFTDA